MSENERAIALCAELIATCDGERPDAIVDSVSGYIVIHRYNIDDNDLRKAIEDPESGEDTKAAMRAMLALSIEDRHRALEMAWGRIPYPENYSC